MSRYRFCFCFLCAVLGAALALAMIAWTPRTIAAQTPAKQAVAKAAAVHKPVSFINDVAPILKEACFGCHGAKNPKGKLDMTRYEALRRGGTKEDPIAEGKPEDSYLVDVLTADSDDEVIAMIKSRPHDLCVEIWHGGRFVFRRPPSARKERRFQVIQGGKIQ